MKKIIVSVSPEGNVTIETKGYTGKACKDASKFMEDALGQTTGETLTPAYRQIAPETKNQTKASQ